MFFYFYFKHLLFFASLRGFVYLSHMKLRVVIQNILGCVAGMFMGSLVNMGVLVLLNRLLAVPAVSDPGNVEQLALLIPHFQPIHFIPAFLAHALGTFTGALIASLCWNGKSFTGAGIIGVLFLVGGISMALSLPAPQWFMALDLGLAYFPPALLGYISAKKWAIYKKR